MERATEVKKIAMLGGKEWGEFLTSLMQPFGLKQKDQAKEWISDINQLFVCIEILPQI